MILPSIGVHPWLLNKFLKLFWDSQPRIGESFRAKGIKIHDDGDLEQIVSVGVEH